MKSVRTYLTVNTSLVVLGFWVGQLEPVSAANFTYNVSRTAPCSDGCSGEISVAGTITTDTLGQLTQDNFVDWSLIFNSPDYQIERKHRRRSRFRSTSAKVGAIAQFL